MKEFLAEKLLAKVLSWEPSDVAKERPLLQAMASLKYDAYEQFSPGLRFLESLALWLNQFEPADRAIAYQFVKSSLVFAQQRKWIIWSRQRIKTTSDRYSLRSPPASSM